MMQQSIGRSFRDRNNLKPKAVVISLSDYNDWRKKLFDRAEYIKKFDKQSDLIQSEVNQ